jgi:heat shock protein HslJ
VTRGGDALRFGNVGMTRMACQADVQAATERSFLAALRATRHVAGDNGALVFLDSDHNEVARFENMRAP